VRSIDRPASAVQDSPVVVHPHHDPAASPADPRPSPPRAPWVIRTPVDSLDARAMTVRGPDGRTRPLSGRVRLMLLILDGHCRNRCYCWVGNAELAAMYGCEERTLQEILKEMEDDGLLVRVLTDRGRRGRVGIVLRRRADPTLPVADTDRSLALAIASLKDQREAALEQRRVARKTAPPARGKPRPPSTRKTAPELRSWSSEEDGLEEDGPETSSEISTLRPRPGPAVGARGPGDLPPPATPIAVALPVLPRAIEAPAAGPTPPIIPAPAPLVGELAQPFVSAPATSADEPAPPIIPALPSSAGEPAQPVVPAARACEPGNARLPAVPVAVVLPAPPRVIEAPAAGPAPPIVPAPPASADEPAPPIIPAPPPCAGELAPPIVPAPAPSLVASSPPDPLPAPAPGRCGPPAHRPAAAGGPDDGVFLEWLTLPPDDPRHRWALRRLGLPGGAPAAFTPAPSRDPEAAFLAGLSPDLRAKLDALSEARRSDLLHRARRHPDRERRRLAQEPDPRKRPPDPLAGAPPEARIEALGTWRGRGLVTAPEMTRRLMLELGAEEAYWPFYEKLCREVEAGTRPPACLLEARRQALGPRALHPSKVFMAAVKNWDRAHPVPAHPD
jgi:hypothetical protein